MMRSFAVGVILSLFFAPLPVAACPLALLLALDVSSSVDDREHRLQSEGVARALLDPIVLETILSQNGIWFAAFEWSGPRKNRILVNWTHLDSLPAIVEASKTIQQAPRSTNEFPTALGSALGFASVFMQEAPPTCVRRVVDIAGDGVNNEGFPPASAFRAFDFEGVTINGLVIKGADPDPVGFYRREVIRGPGAFIEVAEGYGDYAEAMRRKLIREVLSGHFAGDVPAPNNTY